jgi:hypothetical protein
MPGVPASVAWGPVHTVRLPIAVGSDRHFALTDAGTPDGRFLIGTVDRNDFANTTSTRPGDAVLYEIGTATLRTMATLGHPDSQMLSAAADDDWVVWQEAADQPNFLDWHLYAYSRATSTVREIAKATRSDDHPVTGPISFVWLSHGVAVWGQAIGQGAEPGHLENAVVRRADLATGKVSTVATSAGWPALSWPWLAWEEFPDGGAQRAVVTNLETGWKGSLPVVPPVIALDGPSAAFGAPDSHSIWLVDDVTRPETAAEIAHGATKADYLEWPTLNARIAAWAQNEASIVYDRAEHRLVTLPIDSGWSSGVVAGPNLVWEEQDPGHPGSGDYGSVIVLDTTTLPVIP